MSSCWQWTNWSSGCRSRRWLDEKSRDWRWRKRILTLRPSASPGGPASPCPTGLLTHVAAGPRRPLARILRPALFHFVAKFVPGYAVISHQEIAPNTKVQSMGVASIDE